MEFKRDETKKDEKFSVGLMILAIIAIIIGFIAAREVNVEKWLNKDSDPITLTEIIANNDGKYAGKTAGEDIPRLTSSEELAEKEENEYYELEPRDAAYFTVEPKNVIKTGIYGIHPWASPYKKGGRRKELVSDSYISSIFEYSEFYLVQLPDDSYILARFNEKYLKEIEKGNPVTLPIGFKKSTGYKQDREVLKEICSKYGADDSYEFYAVDTEWNQEHELSVLLLTAGTGVVVFFVIIFIFAVISEKIERRFKAKKDASVVE